MAAGSRGETAELIFLNGERLGYCRWNDTNAADRSAVATAPQGDYSCEIQLQILSCKKQVTSAGSLAEEEEDCHLHFETQGVPAVIANEFISSFILEQKFTFCQRDSVRVFKPAQAVVELIHNWR